MEGRHALPAQLRAAPRPCGWQLRDRDEAQDQDVRDEDEEEEWEVTAEGGWVPWNPTVEREAVECFDWDGAAASSCQRGCVESEQRRPGVRHDRDGWGAWEKQVQGGGEWCNQEKQGSELELGNWSGVQGDSPTDSSDEESDTGGDRRDGSGEGHEEDGGGGHDGSGTKQAEQREAEGPASSRDEGEERGGKAQVQAHSCSCAAAHCSAFSHSVCLPATGSSPQPGCAGRSQQPVAAAPLLGDVKSLKGVLVHCRQVCQHTQQKVSAVHLQMHATARALRRVQAPAVAGQRAAAAAALAAGSVHHPLMRSLHSGDAALQRPLSPLKRPLEARSCNAQLQLSDTHKLVELQPEQHNSWAQAGGRPKAWGRVPSAAPADAATAAQQHTKAQVSAWAARAAHAAAVTACEAWQRASCYAELQWLGGTPCGCLAAAWLGGEPRDVARSLWESVEAVGGAEHGRTTEAALAAVGRGVWGSGVDAATVAAFKAHMAAEQR